MRAQNQALSEEGAREKESDKEFWTSARGAEAALTEKKPRIPCAGNSQKQLACRQDLSEGGENYDSKEGTLSRGEAQKRDRP